jgi:hypothetical protein
MKYLKRFKDKDDFVKKLTDDEIINIIGLKGSGKTTTSKKYIDNKDYIVINCDMLFELPCDDKTNEELKIIIDELKKKYKSIKDADFINIYNYIVDYSKKHNKKCLIEGNAIEDLDINSLKGTIIIKRTGVFKCFRRAVKRDYKNKYFMDLEKKEHKYLYKITRFNKVFKRRFKIFKQAKELDKTIEKVNLK